MDQTSEAIEIEASIEARRKAIESECINSKIDLTAAGLDDLDSLTVAICLYQKDSKIDSLYLGTNSISDEGLEAISNSLSKHPELRHLYLGNNLFRDVGFSALSNILPELRNLTTLSLGGAQLTDSSCTSLATSLMAMEESSLKYLFLNGNSIGDEGLLSLVY
jgi:Ran GTPase-activating protein (RanGAP) involved in mRNA processing and transport